MQKVKRLLVIEKIISGGNITSQEMLLKKLSGRGIKCTQATLSRDLRQLGAGRISDGRGEYIYSLPGSGKDKAVIKGEQQVLPVIIDLVDARGLLVIRTLPGNANSTAYFIDNTSRYEIAGTIAGDDTVLVIPRKGVTVSQVHTCLETIIPGLHGKINK